MRILHVIHTPRHSGAETLVAALTIIHKDMGHSSQVVSLNPTEASFHDIAREQSENKINWITPTSKLKKLARIIFIRKAVKSYKPDVVFAHSVIPAAYSRIAGISNVITVLHDASEDDYFSARYKFSEKLLQYRSSGVITVSEDARKNYEKRFKAPKSATIKNGISLDKWTRSETARSSIRASLGLGEEDFVAIQVGRISQAKQQHLSIQAIASIISKHSNIHLLLPGIIEDEDYFDQLRIMIKKYGIDQNIHFLGPRQDIQNLLSSADLYLMPSRREAHSVAMIEALASGLPIIASQISSFSYTKKYEGITLLKPEETNKYAEAINTHIKATPIYKRSLNDLSIENTASQYIEFAKQCTY